jgi:hypothetical protein
VIFNKGHKDNVSGVKWNKKARYALVVTIKTPEEKMDIYTPVATKIGVKIPIEIKT